MSTSKIYFTNCPSTKRSNAIFPTTNQVPYTRYTTNVTPTNQPNTRYRPTNSELYHTKGPQGPTKRHTNAMSHVVQGQKDQGRDDYSKELYRATKESKLIKYRNTYTKRRPL